MANNYITQLQIVARCKENNIPFAVLSLQDGATIVVTQRGARIFGPFLAPDAPSFNWVNAAFADASSFRAFLSEDIWNLGGERVWIGPEIQFGVRDRTDFWNSLVVQRAMDPGAFVLLDQPAAKRVRVTQTLELEAYNLATGVKRLTYESVIRSIDNPLRTLHQVDDLMAGVRFAGYEQRITLAEDAADAIVAEVWNLVAVNPGGVLLIPTTPGVTPTDYFEPIDAAHQTIGAHHVGLKITGERRYKVGYPAAHILGRAAYFNELSQGRGYLLVRSFFSNPSSHYSDEPPELPGRHGSSMHVYNDGGGFGGFGEIECNGQTIGGRSARAQSTDQFVMWLFEGPIARLRQISLLLVGADPHDQLRS